MKKALVEKTKTIGFLEKQLNDKNLIIASLKSKLEKINETTLKSSYVTVEKNLVLQNDLTCTMRTIKEKDDLLKEKSKVFEEILNEYRTKIQNFMNINNSLLNKLKEADSTTKILKNKCDIAHFDCAKKVDQIHNLSTELESYKLESEINKQSSKID